MKVTPDSAELIKAYFITSTWSPGGSGREKAKEIVAGVDKFITAEQYQGLSADGHTIAIHVGDYIAEHYQALGHDDYDPLHSCGRVDARMRDKKEFQFLVKDTKTVAEVYKLLNIGKEFYNFFQVCAQLKKEGFEINMKVPRFFS